MHLFASSMNDASKEMSIGELSRSENLEDFDTQTITAAKWNISLYMQSRHGIVPGDLLYWNKI